MGALVYIIYSINYFASFLSRVLQTMPLAPPPPTHPPKSPPLHQSAPVGKGQDNKTDIIIDSNQLALISYVVILLLSHSDRLY